MQGNRSFVPWDLVAQRPIAAIVAPDLKAQHRIGASKHQYHHGLAERLQLFHARLSENAVSPRSSF